ncbi:acyltransferase family protein [Desertivirga arenae]|uniref:acyltransferase family protein n=1 Tax=Desertivirga arenae TaxID=2810309 RepID=UPI001A9741ED|nr:acyltransferase [Pedobacter sp. SYSU D00823]
MNSKFSLKYLFSSDVQSVPAVLRASYFSSLDGFRAVSIMLVVIFHIVLTFDLAYDFHPLANLGVQFFFVISGFLITTILMKEKLKKGTIGLKRFYVRRAFRILPVAFIYLALMLVLKVFFKIDIDYLAIVTCFLFIRNFYITSFHGFSHLTTHFWSLSIEEQYYLIFPFFLKKSVRFYMILMFLILATTVISTIYNEFSEIPNSAFTMFVTGFITQFQGIAVGSIYSLLIFKRVISLDKPIKNKLIINLIIFAGICLLTLNSNKFTGIIIMIQSVMFAMLIGINLRSQSDSDISFKFLNNKVMRMIGLLSYSIYIWQQPFTLGFSYLKSKSFVANSGHLVLMSSSITIISVIALGVISYLSYFFYEKKFLQFKEIYK